MSPLSTEQQLEHMQAAAAAEKDRVLCKDGRVFHACEICRKRRSRCDGARPQCNSCQKRGLTCEYRAMRKRGRHGKKSATPQPTTTTSASAVVAGSESVASYDSAWLVSSQAAPGKTESKHSEDLGLLGYPPFFSTLSSTSGEVEQMISAMTSPPANGAGNPAMMAQVPEAAANMQAAPPRQHRQQSAASIDSTLFSSLGASQPVAAAVSSLATGITSPLTLTGILPSSASNVFVHTSSPVISPTSSQQPGLFAAVAAMQQFSTQAMMAGTPTASSPPLQPLPTPLPPVLPVRVNSMPPPTLPTGMGRKRGREATVVSAAEAAAAKRHDRGNWSREMDDEERVLAALNSNSNDSFGRPIYDSMSYPLPPTGELDEHVNGVFEYFYMGGQTLHEASFRRRLSRGAVEPVLVYAIMAVASRYSRRPSLHALNGMAFLNGDRYAIIACGLASVQLNHGDLSTMDAVHAMLFLSVYFMGQGNMLKSRMYLVKAVCTARTMGFQSLDAPLAPSNPMTSFNGSFDRIRGSGSGAVTCACPRTVGEVIEQETRRRIWWFLVFVDYFTANVMNVPLEIPPESYCVRLPCSDEEWMSESLMSIDDMMAMTGSNTGESSTHPSVPPVLLDSEPVRQCPGLHGCRPPWKFHASAFYLERLMVEFCDHLRRLNSLRSLASRSFFFSEPVFVDEDYPYLKRTKQVQSWVERLAKVKSQWSWLHLQLNKWLDSILLRFTEVLNRVPLDLYNRQYRHQYYYYLIAAHAAIIMSHGVILQLFTDLSRYIKQQEQAILSSTRRSPVAASNGLGLVGSPEFSHFSAAAGHTITSSSASLSPAAAAAATMGLLGSNGSDGLADFGIGALNSVMTPLMNSNSSVYSSLMGSPMSYPSAQSLSGGQGMLDDFLDANNAEREHFGIHAVAAAAAGFGVGNGSNGAGGGLGSRGTPNAVLRELHDMANIAWESCVSTAEQLASVLRGRHPKFVLLGGPSTDSLVGEFGATASAQATAAPSASGSAFNAPGTGPGTDNPLLSDPDLYMRLQPSTAWWIFLVAQVQVGHIKRMLRESDGCFRTTPTTTSKSQQSNGVRGVSATPEFGPVDRDGGLGKEAEEVLGISPGLSRPTDKIRPLSASVSNSAFMLATAVQLSNAAPPPPTRQGAEKRATIKIRASRLGKAYENLSCLVRVLEGMQQYWHCMDYVAVIQRILKGSEDPFP